MSTIDVEDLIDGERDVEVSDENRAETLAYQQMMTYIRALHDFEDFSYSKGLLNALHWMLQRHRNAVRKPAGQWRRGPVYVTDGRDPSIAATSKPRPFKAGSTAPDGYGRHCSTSPKTRARTSE